MIVTIGKIYLSDGLYRRGGLINGSPRWSL